MLKKCMYLFFSVMLLMQTLGAMPAHASDFCWKSSYGRNVGTIPQGCSGGRNKEVGMCYTPCKQGWEGAVTMCLRQCPSNYVNTGFTCHIDKALLVGANIDVCNMKTSCPSGYTNAGLLCGLTTPSVPPGYQAAVSGPAASGLDLSRQIYDRGIGLAPDVCTDGKENDAGLCYPKCKPNFSGVGPVCWGQCPSGWVNCGASCARSARQCTETIVGQVAGVAMSVGSIVALVASAGTSGAATTAANQARASTIAAKLAELKKWYADNKLALQVATKSTSAGLKIEALTEAVTDEDIARLSIQLAGLLDPTGLASASAEFVQPTCDKIDN